MTVPIKRSLQEIAELVGGHAEGQPDLAITGVAGISEAAQGDLTFIQDLRRLPEAEQSAAAAVIAPPSARSGTKPLIISENPRLAFAMALESFHPEQRAKPGIHSTAQIGEHVELGANVCVGAYVTIGDGAIIGDETVLHSLVVVGEGAKIGRRCEIHPQVTLYPCVEIGDRVILHAGVAIGGDGFGYHQVENRQYKIPQVGTVIIEDDVEIGSNSAVDRATTGQTRVGRGTKIDNLVHVAHNSRIGEDCAIAALTGISGSVTIGDRTMLAGEVGVADHVDIGSDCIIAGRAGVIGDIPNGSFVSGFPARPHREEMRFQASLRQVSKLLETVKDLKKRIEELEKGR